MEHHPDKSTGPEHAFKQLALVKNVIMRAVGRKLDVSQGPTSKAKSTFPDILCSYKTCTNLLLQLSICLGCAPGKDHQSCSAWLQAGTARPPNF